MVLVARGSLAYLAGIPHSVVLLSLPDDWCCEGLWVIACVVFEPHNEMWGRVVVTNFSMSSFRMHLYLAQVCGDEVHD